MSSSMHIACIGEAMIEVSATTIPGDGQLGVAGDTLNTAIYLRRCLSAKYSVSYVTALGEDSLSDQMLRYMQSENIETQHIERRSDLLPGLYAINTDSDGERSFVYWRENSAARRLFSQDSDITFEQLHEFDVIYLSAITLAVLSADARQQLFDWLPTYRKRGGLFAFDSNFRPRLWEDLQTAQSCVKQAWSQCDIALPSLDDELALFQEKSEAAVLQRFASYAIQVGVLKRGAVGPIALHGPYDSSQDFPAAESVVDTTAAGDSFSGAFLAAYIDGQPIDKAMRQAHNLASQVVGFPGAIMPRSQ